MTWPECVAYTCGTCGEQTINEVGTPCIEANECPSCYEIPALEQASEEPEPRPEPTGSSADASAGSPEAAPFPWGADPEAGAASPPTGGRRRTSGGAEESGIPTHRGATGDHGRVRR